MKRILVPTDFSQNSKAGIRFALRWSLEEKLDLVFIHVIVAVKPLDWSDDTNAQYLDKQTGVYKDKLKDFVGRVFAQTAITPDRYRCVVIESISADLAILEYCEKHEDIDFICMGTLGATGLGKVLGTNTGNLITKSKVPVIAVPSGYRSGKMKKLMYATDLVDCKDELKTVVPFAQAVKAHLEVLHVAWPDEPVPDRAIIESGMRSLFKFPIVLSLKKADTRYSLLENLKRYMEEAKPSLAIMFTNQDRDLFHKIFLSSNAERLSFDLHIPLLVFHKEYQDS